MHDTQFVVQRTDSRMFWAGVHGWVEHADEAVRYPTQQEAVTSFVLGYVGPVVMFLPVPYRAHVH